MFSTDEWIEQLHPPFQRNGLVGTYETEDEYIGVFKNNGTYKLPKQKWQQWSQKYPFMKTLIRHFEASGRYKFTLIPITFLDHSYAILIIDRNDHLEVAFKMLSCENGKNTISTPSDADDIVLESSLIDAIDEILEWEITNSIDRLKIITGSKTVRYCEILTRYKDKNKV
jgi:hypothetical protein